MKQKVSLQCDTRNKKVSLVMSYIWMCRHIYCCSANFHRQNLVISKETTWSGILCKSKILIWPVDHHKLAWFESYFKICALYITTLLSTFLSNVAAPCIYDFSRHCTLWYSYSTIMGWIYWIFDIFAKFCDNQLLTEYTWWKTMLNIYPEKPWTLLTVHRNIDP